MSGPAADRDQTVERIERSRDDLERLGVISLALFGSAARDQLEPGSDIDILVEFAPPRTFDRYMDVKLLLEERLGRRVDLVTRSALKPGLREAIANELIRVA